MDITAAATLVTEIGILMAVVIPVIVAVRKISNGTRCQLRSEMLRTYYRHREDGQIRQYEYENVVLLYKAYKALGGNTFVDHIYNEINEWEVVS